MPSLSKNGTSKSDLKKRFTAIEAANSRMVSKVN